MKRSEVRQFVEDGVNQITPALDYYEGLITDFNSKRNNQYPAVHLLLETTDTELDGSAPTDDWDIVLIIAKLDKMDSLPPQYEGIVDDCHYISQQLIYKYRNIVNGYKLVTIEDVKREKFVKKYADCLTGIELSFTLKAPDQTNVC